MSSNSRNSESKAVMYEGETDLDREPARPEFSKNTPLRFVQPLEQELLNPEESAPPLHPRSVSLEHRQGRIFEKAFWFILNVAVGVTLLLYAIAFVRSNFFAPVASTVLISRGPIPDTTDVIPDETEVAQIELPLSLKPKDFDLEQTLIERFVIEASHTAEQEQLALINARIDEAFSVVYDNIKTYADFNYSVVGQYTQLTTAIVGDLTQTILDDLFEDLEPRLVAVSETVETELGVTFSTEFERALVVELAKALPDQSISLNAVNDINKLVLAIKRNVTHGELFTNALAAKSAVVVGAVAFRAGLRASIVTAARAIAKRLAAKAVAQAAAKAAIKGGQVTVAAAGGVGAGAAAGALVGTVCGPAAPVCMVVGGVGGAAAVWFGTDKIIVELDEHFTRDAFEAELKVLVDQQRDEMRSLFRSAISDASEQIVAQTFKISDLN